MFIKKSLKSIENIISHDKNHSLNEIKYIKFYSLHYF